MGQGPHTVAPPAERPATGSRVTSTVAQLVCVGVGAWFPLVQGVTPALLLAVLLLPVWIGTLWSYRAGRWFLGLGATAMVSGVVLTSAASIDHASSTSTMRGNLILLATLLGGVGLLVWARRALSAPVMATCFGIGAVLAALVRDGAENPWKYNYSVPVSILVLALCLWARTRRPALIATGALALVSALNDSRSAASLMLLVLALVLWQVVRDGLRARSGTLGTVVQLAVLACAVFLGMQTLLLDGYLGDDAQLRTEAQVEASGGIFAGGRPEMGASVALITANPLGVGAGTVPNLADITVAKSGMAALDYDPNNGYVERYLFGSGYEVHSVAGDLWLRFGIAGIALGLLCVGVVLHRLTRSLSRNEAPALLIYLAVTIVWDFLFSPLFWASVTPLMLGVALALTGAHGRQNARGENT